jgi:hypothetical protein
VRLHFAARLDVDLPLRRIAISEDRAVGIASRCEVLHDPDGIQCLSTVVEFDLSIPHAPREVGRHSIGGENEEAVELALVGDLLYVAYQQRGPNVPVGVRLGLYRMVAGRSPEERASLHRHGLREHLALKVGRGLVAWSSRAPDLPEQGDVLLLEPDDPESPGALLQRSRIARPARALGLGSGDTGPRLYLATTRAEPRGEDIGLWIYDITDATSPRPIAQVEGDFTDLMADGSHLVLERYGVRICSDLDPRIPPWPCGFGIEEMDLVRLEHPRAVWDRIDMNLDAAGLISKDVLLVAEGRRLLALDRRERLWPLRPERVLQEHSLGDTPNVTALDMEYAPRFGWAASPGGFVYLLLRPGGPRTPTRQLYTLSVSHGWRLWLPRLVSATRPR